MAFRYVDITTRGCDGWLNLFWDDHCIALIDNAELAAQMRCALGVEDDAGHKACEEICEIFAGEVLRKLEWSATYSYCTGWPSCPICGGIKPGFGKDEDGNPPDNQGHREGCDLATAMHNKD